MHYFCYKWRAIRKWLSVVAILIGGSYCFSTYAELEPQQLEVAYNFFLVGTYSQCFQLVSERVCGDDSYNARRINLASYVSELAGANNNQHEVERCRVYDKDVICLELCQDDIGNLTKQLYFDLATRFIFAVCFCEATFSLHTTLK